MARTMSGKLTLYYAGDIHGSEKCFLKFVKAARFYGAQALILGGDITGKAIVTLVGDKSCGFDMSFLGRDYHLATEAELLEAEKSIRFNGMYPYPCDADELRHMDKDESYRNQVWEAVTKQSVQRWIELAQERLAGTGIRVLAMAGNDDEWYIDEVLDQDSCIEFCDRRVLDLEDWQVLSLSWANPTPWSSPREFSEEDLTSELKRLAQDLQPNRPWRS